MQLCTSFEALYSVSPFYTLKFIDTCENSIVVPVSAHLATRNSNRGTVEDTSVNKNIMTKQLTTGDKIQMCHFIIFSVEKKKIYFFLNSN